MDSEKLRELEELISKYPNLLGDDITRLIELLDEKMSYED